MGWLKAYCLLLALGVAVGQQYSSNSNKLRERMKLVSGGGAPHPTRPPLPTPMSPYADIQYSEPKLEGPYKSDGSWNPAGMGQLYSITRLFLSWILKEQAYPQSMISVRGNNIEFGDPSQHWQEWLQFYAGPVGVVGVGLIFSILLPIIGLVLCCCVCAGKCGARPKRERRHDPCKRGFLATLLLALAVIFLFGVVCVFVTGEQLRQGIYGMVPSAKVSLSDSDLYLRNTKKEVDNLLIDNFKQLEQRLNALLANTGAIVSEQLAKASHAVVLSNLTEMAAGLEVVMTDLRDIAESTRQVQSTATELADSLDQTREELLRELSACRSEPSCRQLLLLPQIRELRVVQNFSQLPDVSRTFASISSLVGNGSVDSIQQQVLEGQRSLDHIKDEVTASVQSSIPYVASSLQHTGEQLETAAEKIKRAINEVQNLLNHLSGRTLDEAGAFIDSTGIYDYHYHCLMGVCLLAVLLCICCGILCGICGKRREEVYSEYGELCTIMVGGRFLFLAIWLMFFLSGFMMIVTLALFLMGTAATVAVCRPLSDPAHDQIFWLADHFVDLDGIYQGKHVDINLSQIITMCHRNHSMYTAFKLVNVMNIDEVMYYKTRYQVDEQVQRFKERVVVRTERVQLLSPAARRRLGDLALSPVNDIQFSRYTDQLSSSLTTINLLELSQRLKTHADQIPPGSVSGYDVAYLRRLLRTKAQFLELLQRSHVARVQEGVAALKANVSALKRHLKFNHSSLRVAVEGLIAELDAAQRYLVANGTAHMRVLVDDFAIMYMGYVDEYLSRVVRKTEEDIGRCGVLSKVYNATRVAGCNRVVDPFNGYWASVGWCLLLFLPAIILCFKLSPLYQRKEAYTAPGIYPESEYLYDAYADRDNMPLAVTQGDKKQNHHRSYQETYENGGGGYLQDYSAHLSRAERPATAEARFSDAAPKQWDSRGPPRYAQPPSTEYERPPPYYYPGPNERP